MAAVFWIEMMDARGKLALTALWLVIAVMVCGAFVMNAGAPFGAVVVLAAAHALAVIVGLMQMILNAHGPSRTVFLLFAGGWAMTAWLFAGDWMNLDVQQMRGWLLACLLLAGACVAATWWEEMRWRRAAGLWGATVALWLMCGPADVVNRALDGGQTWDVHPAVFRDPFFMAHESGDHLVVTNMAWRRVPGAQNQLTSYRDGVVVRRVALHGDMSAIGFSLPWNGRFALLQTINTYPPTATGPAETWVDVYDATLQKESTLGLPALSHAWIASHPHFRFGTPRSPWRMIPLVDAGPNVAAVLPTRPSRREILLWNQETGETKTFDDYWGGYIGGWVDEATLAYMRLELEQEEETNRVLSSTFQMELLNIHSGDVETLPSMTFEGYGIPRWVYRDQLTFARVGRHLSMIDWRDRSVRTMGRSNDGKALHVMETPDGVVVAWATEGDSEGKQTLNVMREDGSVKTLEGLEEKVSDVWLSPDFKSVLFTQTREVHPMFDVHPPVQRGSWRVWNVESGDVQTIHRRGLNDSGLFYRSDSMRMSPGCSPWSNDSRRVAIVHSRVRFLGLDASYYVLRVVEVK